MSSFTICSLNCNGVRAAYKKGFDTWLAKHRPDVLCLQELRANPEQLKPVQRCPPGYNTRQIQAEKKGYSGVGIWSRPPADRYEVGSGLPWGDSEARVLRADFGELSVVSVYLPSGSSGSPRQEKKYQYMDHLFEWMQGLLAEKRPIAVCGDLNIAHTELDIHNPKGNAKNSGFLPEEREWFGLLLAEGWVDVFRELHPDEPGLYSWWSARGQAKALDRGWRLDYLLANEMLASRATEAWIDKDAGLSDHAPVWVRFDGDVPVRAR